MEELIKLCNILFFIGCLVTVKAQVDGVWNNWSNWTECTLTCGTGSQERNRTCDGPYYDGADCPGKPHEKRDCNTHPCPIDGEFTTWSDWGECDVTCGGGLQWRNRSCYGPFHGGAECEGNFTDSQECNTQNCPIDGVWKDWGAWEECTVTCGGGIQVRNRTCVGPFYNGDDCPGSANDTKICGTTLCPSTGSGCEPNPCMNGGTCFPDATNGFTCSCDPYYTGYNCETPNDGTSSGCDSDPCLGQGSCSADSFGDYECTCYTPYFGRNCEHNGEELGGEDPCSKIHCENGGTCSSLEAFPYAMCDCDWEQYYGAYCQYSYPSSNMCASSMCMNDGTCVEMAAPPNYYCDCPLEYTGFMCETDAATGNMCTNPMCMNDGTCEEIAAPPYYYCNCLPEYTGYMCETYAATGTDPSCVSDPCQNGGSCSSDGFGGHVCTCFGDFYGRDCEIYHVPGDNACDNPEIVCLNGATCTPQEIQPFFTCECNWAMFTGTFCEHSTHSTDPSCVSDPCQNGGSCHPDGFGGHGCTCFGDYYGRDCEIYHTPGDNACDNSEIVCLNGATCTPQEVQPFFTCECNWAMFTGTFCEHSIHSTDPSCVSDPCQNGGSCYPDGFGGHGCTCFGDYYGRDCEIYHVLGDNACDNPEIECLNGATCTPQDIQPFFTCECNWAMFTGTFCEHSTHSTDPSCVSDPCQNGGSCSSDGFGGHVCTCFGDYYGRDCEIYHAPGDNACDNPEIVCLNGATCTPQEIQPFFTCECNWAMFTGTFCEHSTHSTDPSCVSDPCQNGGSCYPDGFGGHGCTCFGDYYGRDCEIYHVPGDNACDNPEIECLNGATCTPQEIQPFFTCECNWAMFTGTFCEHSTHSNPCDTNPCGDNGYCSSSADPPYYHCSGPSYTPKDLEIRVEGCEKRYNMTQGETKTFRGWCEAAAADSYIPFRVIVFAIDTTKIYPLSIVISYMGTDTTEVLDVIGANTTPVEDGFVDVTAQVENMEITAPSPPTDECLFKDAFLFVAIYEQNNDDRKYKTKKQRISILCDFTGVDLEVTISAGTGAVNSARNDGSSTLGDLIGPNNAISVKEVPGSNSLPNLGSAIFVIAYITKRPVDNNFMCTEPPESSDMEFNDTLIYNRLFKNVGELIGLGTDLKSKTFKAPNHCGESTMVIQVDAVHSIPEEKKCNNYVTLSIYLEGCDANMPVPRCGVIPDPYGIGQETALTFQHTHFTPGIPGINDYRMYKFGENGSWRQEMLEPGYTEDWYTAMNDIRNNKVGNARLKLLKAYVGSKTDTRLTCPTTETDAKAKVVEMEDLNPDESSVPETAENIANLLPKYFQAFGSLDSASISLTSAELDTKLMDLSNAFSDPTLTSAQKVDNGAAYGMYSAMFNISSTSGNDEAEAVLKAGARYNVCSTGDLLIGYKYISMYSSGDGMGADSYYAMYKRTYIAQIAKNLAFMKYFFGDAPFYNCLQKTFELFLRHAVGQINGTAWLMDPCTSKPNNCLMKAKDFCRSRSDTCAETTNFVESGEMDETLCEMMNLKDFIGLEEFPLFDIAKRMKENHEYRIQQDTSGGMSMMTNDAETECRGDEWLLSRGGSIVLFKQKEDGTVMVGKPNAEKGTICWNPEAVCTCEECTPAASTSGSDAGMTKKRKK